VKLKDIVCMRTSHTHQVHTAQTAQDKNTG